MNVFISYSLDDNELIAKIDEAIGPDATVRYWAKSKEPGKEVWPTIFGWIESADLVVAVITDKTVARAMAVGQEIGHAKAKRKTIMPLVAEGVPAQELGFLSGITYEPISRDDPSNAIAAIRREVRWIKSSQQAKETLILIGLAVLALYIIAGSKKG